jgi:hypothetical protein
VWLKSVEEFVVPEATAQAEPPQSAESVVIPETAGPARDALLNEPTVRIHSLSDHDEIPADDESFSVRPVIAERSERHIPKDDLLTPRELANAFHIQFNFDESNGDRPLSSVRRAARKAKLGLAGSAAIAVGFLIGMQGIRMLAVHLNQPTPPVAAVSIAAPSTPIQLPPMDPVGTADSRLNAAILADSAQPVMDKAIDKAMDKKPADAAPVTRPSPATPAAEKPAAPKATGNAIVTGPNSTSRSPDVMPVMMVEPAATQAVEDDPKVLLNAGFTAESNGNYAAAVRYYERIQSLPSSQWPAHLDTRLQLARQELKGDLR